MMKKFTGIIALVLCFINSHAQQQFDSLLNIANEQYPQEKIYLQLDRPYYNTGETIWFKAYITGVSSPSRGQGAGRGTPADPEPDVRTAHVARAVPAAPPSARRPDRA